MTSYFDAVLSEEERAAIIQSSAASVEATDEANIEAIMKKFLEDQRRNATKTTFIGYSGNSWGKKEREKMRPSE